MTPTMDTSASIHAWLTCRDQQAARWLVESHRDMVARVVSRWMPHQALVEDVVQDVFARIFATLGRFDAERPFIPWLMRITRNTCSFRLRCWKRTRSFAACENPFDALADEDLPDDSQAASAADLMEREEYRAAMVSLVRKMPPADRELLLLQHEHGASTEEVADRLGITAGNVRIRTFRARQILRKRLAALAPA